mmetsp:Transcript_27528/g.65124  ORF Transcript_27528/g.65124 Transcript_27528/m.65124 type:complete len:530 (-) Transcript_27528:41-1630(-)
MYAVPLVLWMLFVARAQLLTLRTFPILILAGLLGLTPYAYLPFAGKNAGFGAWGEMDSMEGFLTHFLRKEYGTFRLYSGNDNKHGEQLSKALVLYVKNVSMESMLTIGAPVALLGVLRSLTESLSARSLDSAGFAIALAFTFYMVLFHYLSNLPLDQPLYFGVHMRFWMQAHIVAFAWLGLGAAPIWRLLPPRFASPTAALCTLALVAAQIGLHFKKMDQSSNDYVHNYGLMNLEKLPHNSMLIVKGDVITNSVRYLQRCEGVRLDVQHFDQSMMTYEWFVKKQARHFKNITFPNLVYNPYKEIGYSMELFLESNLDPSRPMFLCGGWYHDELPTDMGGGIPGFKTWAVGACDRIRSEESPPSLAEWISEAEALSPTYTPPDAAKYPEDTWERVTLTDYWAAKHKLPYSLLTWAMAHNDDQEALQQSAARFEDLIAEHPDPPDYFYKNAGIVYGRLRMGGNQCKMISSFANFLIKTNEGPHETKDIVKIVKDYMVHVKRLKKAGQKADCEKETVLVAKAAYKRHKPIAK